MSPVPSTLGFKQALGSYTVLGAKCLNVNNYQLHCATG